MDPRRSSNPMGDGAAREQQHTARVAESKPPGCGSNERIGVYVRKSHWAHALIEQNMQLEAALRDDDDVMLKRLLATGASPNATNLAGVTLLGVAIHEGRTRCRAALEEIGAKRGLPPRTPPPGRDEDSATGPLVVVRPRIPKHPWLRHIRCLSVLDACCCVDPLSLRAWYARLAPPPPPARSALTRA